MRVLTSTLLATAILAIGAGTAQPARAATANVSSWIPSQNCVLSIPTTNTGVRPRGTGFRNEGTVNNFVICPANPTGAAGTATSVSLYARSFDGADHTFDCTFTNAVDAPVYSTKSVTVLAGGGTSFTSWVPADVGQTDDFNNSISAVTCILPPGASIQATYLGYPINIGN